MYHRGMREIVLALALAGCGATQQPLLANAPRPNPAAVAGGAAAAAAILTAVDPDAATRKPEKKVDGPDHPVEVKETVPSDVLDRVDHRGSADAPATDEPAPPPTNKKRTGPAKRLPTPRDAVEHDKAEHEK
jgi:hypothetical protein